jgi:predicted transcriptional regulator
MELAQRGMTKRQIARELGMGRRTVRRWMRSDGFPERKPGLRSSAVDAYAGYLEQRWQQGCHNAAQLWRELKEQTEAAVTVQLAERLAVEKKAITEAEEQRANQRFSDELAERERDNKDKDDRIEKLLARLTIAQNAEAELKRREREFEDREREMTLKIEQEVSGQLDQVRAVAATEAEQRLGLQLSDKDRMIRDLASKLEETLRTIYQRRIPAQRPRYRKESKGHPHLSGVLCKRSYLVYCRGSETD